MARKPNKKPNKKQTLAAIRNCGGFEGAAASLDMASSTFRTMLKSKGWLDEAAEARKANNHKVRKVAAKAQTRADLPPLEDVLRAVAETASVSQAAHALGIPRNTLVGYIEREGWSDKVAAARVRAEQKRIEDEEVREVELLRHRVKELESAARKHRQDDVKDERYIRRIEEAVPAAKPRYSPLAIPKGPRGAEHEFVLLFSDAHAGEVVTRDETLGMNEYDWKVMLDRMARIQRSVLSYQEHRPYPVRKLHIAALGDNLSGSIHEDLAVTNEYADAEATVQFGYDFAKFVGEFVPHFESIGVTGISGNHPRRTKKSSHKRPFNNDDYVAYHVARTYLRSMGSVSFDIPPSDFGTMTVAERWRFLLMHGDGIRSTMPGVPWGGVLRRVTTLESQFAAAGQPVDYVALGHFHSANALDGVGVKTFMNGCFVPGTPVTVGDGSRKPIEEVRTGDEVLTRSGRRMVVHTLPQSFAGNLVALRTGSVVSEVRATPNHEFWAIKGADLATAYPSNGSWERGAFCPEPRWIAAGNLSKGDFIEQAADPNPGRPSGESEGFLWLLGMYLAEGSASGAGGALHHLDFTHHIDEREFADRVEAACLARWGKAVQSQRPDKSIRAVTVHSSEAAREMVALCGKGAANKRLDPDLMTLPPGEQLHVLCGWLQGDGHVNRRNKKGGLVASGSSISPTLVYQMQQIALRNGLSCSVSRMRAGGHPRRKSDVYTLLFTGSSAQRVAALVEGGDAADADDQASLWVAGRCFARISHVWRAPYEGEVYDLEVDGDHSYAVSGHTCHNSVKGVDGFSLKQFGSGRPPRQLLLTVHPRNGVVDVSYLDPEPIRSATQRAHDVAERYAA